MSISNILRKTTYHDDTKHKTQNKLIFRASFFLIFCSILFFACNQSESEVKTVFDTQLESRSAPCEPQGICDPSEEILLISDFKSIYFDCTVNVYATVTICVTLTVMWNTILKTSELK